MIMERDFRYLVEHKRAEKATKYMELFGSHFPTFNYEERKVGVVEYMKVLDKCLEEGKTLEELNIVI